ncbi:hypothetical protein [Balneola vulgaris]|uniref:hypothetical protein n=1 Tax=Balneola vulgaris TaxID=287535 RepID=UPI00037CA941|nr:hypothetical protein [Balneola vulgaris]
MRALPFLIDDLNGGFMKVEGILSVDGDKFSIEFQKKDSLFEAYKSELMHCEISFSDLDLVEFKKGLFTSKLILQAKKAAVFSDLPGDDLISRTLKVKKKHRDIAASIASRVNLELSEMKLRELDE